ncbi:UNVERIFIED_ORG: ABC-type uncharacterized transport system permease subunit [Burkholderia contaminans]|nr:ABC-type uncharacterized transport system permease subunit [Burkholderia contaminans]
MRRRIGAMIAVDWFSLKLKVYLQYKAYIAVWLISGFGPLVTMLVWVGIVNNNRQSAASNDLYAYFAIAYLTKQLTTIWVSDELCRMIRDSDITLRVTRPCWPFWEFGAGHMAGTVIRLGPACAVTLAILLGTGSWKALDLQRIPTYLLALSLSWTIQFASGWLIGSIGFWIREVKPFVIAYSTCIAIGGGLYAPLSLLPTNLRGITEFLPFASTVGDPVALLVPTLATHSQVTSLVTAGWWSTVTVCAAVGIWRLGARRIGVIHS